MICRTRIVPHAAAMDIEAVWQEHRYAPRHQLRPGLRLFSSKPAWATNESMVLDPSNETIICPSLKRRM